MIIARFTKLKTERRPTVMPGVYRKLLVSDGEFTRKWDGPDAESKLAFRATTADSNH